MTNPTEAIQKVTPEIFAFNHSTGASAEGFSREQVKPLVELARKIAEGGCDCEECCNLRDLLAQWSDV